jgi:predicted metal-dependent phosphoesterase TrpH
VADTADRIREQGGVVYAPHPFAYPAGAREKAKRALAHADILEAFNSRAFWPGWNRSARAAAEAHGIPTGAGSDAHFPWEIGRAHTEIQAFDGAAGLREVLATARAEGVKIANPAVHLASVALHVGRWAVAEVAPGVNPVPEPWGFFRTAPVEIP